MAIDPKDVRELQTALNDAAGKASVLWTTFVIFQLYLAIAIGSVTHRDLFLETPIKLPLLNVDLPLVGFFVVAPTVLVIFHFYIFLQLLSLATKAKDYNTLLLQEVHVESDRQHLRQRLDSFLVLQFLAGPKDQRTGFSGFSLRLIAWITLIATPVVVLLQGQVTFLPYHREWIVWLQRVAVLIDLAVIWYFWVRVRSDNEPIRWVPRKAKIYFGVGVSLCVVIFSAYLAVFPGEWVDAHLPELRFIPTTWNPRMSEEGDWTSLQDLLFKGEVDEVSGRPHSVFSNRLVLTNQSFIVDADKLDKVDVSHSFRGRDLSWAVLNRTDLRKADFTGAMLNGATFKFAKLQNAMFSVESRGTEKAKKLSRWPDDGCTWLQGAYFLGAQMQGASLTSAHLQGANLSLAKLQGANLNAAKLQGTMLTAARLHGASLNEAELQGAYLNAAMLQGASLEEARLQGASLMGAHLEGGNLTKASVWVARGSPKIDLTDLDEFDPDTKPWEERADLDEFDPDTKPWEKRRSATGSNFAVWRDDILKNIPTSLRGEPELLLSALDPKILGIADRHKRLPGLLDRKFWESARSMQPQGEQREKRLTVFLTGLACSTEAVPYVARGLITNDRIAATGSQVRTVADTLRKGKSDPAACPGVKGLTDEDWARLEELVAPPIDDTR